MIHVGDCVEVLAGLEPCSVDAVVTDPPYGLEFMGKEWDSFRVDERVARWSGDKSGSSGVITDGQEPSRYGRVSFTGRRTTSRCLTCNRRDAFRNPHACGDAANWTTEWVDGRPIELRAFQAWCEVWAAEVLRVLKPGGHLLAFGGTRTYHRLACAIEEAGFEIRDCLVWLYGSGFPKSLDVSKAIDRQNGAEREVVGDKLNRPGYHLHGHDGGEAFGHGLSSSTPETRLAAAQVTAPATEDAQRWEGWGTALKPAHEPIVLARKPLSGTVAGNVLLHGTGGLNIGGTRIGFQSDADERESKDKNRHADFGTEPGGNEVYGDYSMVESKNYDPVGRWPANVILDEHAAELLDGQTEGQIHGAGHARPARPMATRDFSVGVGELRERESMYRLGDSGGASRFFYVAKASRAERNAGLEGFEERDAAERHAYTGLPDQRMENEQARNGSRNHHPTVKPVELMRWLVRLVTPPGGLVLDPFLGSGTTGVAAGLEGFRFVGVERDPEYAKLAEARMKWWQEHGADALRIVRERERAERERAELEAAGQLGLFG